MRSVLGAVIAGGLLYLVVSSAGGVSGALEALRHVHGAWLLPAVGFQLLSYGLYGVHLRQLQGPDLDLGWRAPLLLSFVVFGLGSILPGAPATGVGLGVSQLRRRGMSTRHAALALAWSKWIQMGSFVGLATGNAVIALALGDLALRYSPLVAGAVALTCLMVGGTVAFFSSRALAGAVAVKLARARRRSSRPAATEARAAGAAWHDDAVALVVARTSLPVITLTAAGAWMADGLCLFLTLRSAGVHAPFDIVLLAYSVATVASWAPLAPGGLGAVEAVLPAVLHGFGVPVAPALVGTLLWRGASLFLPAAAGVLALGWLRLDRVPAAAGSALRGPTT